MNKVDRKVELAVNAAMERVAEAQAKCEHTFQIDILEFGSPAYITCSKCLHSEMFDPTDDRQVSRLALA